MSGSPPPDVLVTRALDEPERPAGLLFARGEIECMEQSVGADLVERVPMQVERAGRAEAVCAAVVGRDSLERPLPEDVPAGERQRVDRSGFRRDVDDLFFHTNDRHASRYGRGDDGA